MSPSRVPTPEKNTPFGVREGPATKTKLLATSVVMPPMAPTAAPPAMSRLPTLSTL
jgi:hypothetical protein